MEGKRAKQALNETTSWQQDRRREGSEKSGEPLRRSEGFTNPGSPSQNTYPPSIYEFQLFNGHERSRGNVKNLWSFQARPKNDFVTNYEPVVHLNRKKI